MNTAQVESQMRISLATGMAKAVEGIRRMTDGGELDTAPFLDWLDLYPTQIVVLAAQVRFLHYWKYID